MAPGIGNVVLPTPVYIPTKQASQREPQQQSSLHHHSLITTDSNALQFHAAASLQLKSGQLQDNGHTLPSNDLLITSPYNDPRHLLNLKTLDTANQLLAKALTIFQPIRADYATAPYLDSFNWQAVFDFLRELAQHKEGFHWKRQSFYVVAFRSRLFPDADSGRLGELDAYSHQEATASGGLLKYWFGVKNGNCENLATCELSIFLILMLAELIVVTGLWHSREDARNGGTGPWHKKARGAAKELYEKIDFTTLELVIEDGVSGWEMRNV